MPPFEIAHAGSGRDREAFVDLPYELHRADTAWTCLNAALRRDAGREAETPLDRGLEPTARSYREAGWL